MQLKRLAQRVSDATGLEHSRNLTVLRHYIKSTSETSLLEQVEEIDSVRLLRILWEAGLSTDMQKAVLSQIEEIS